MSSPRQIYHYSLPDFLQKLFFWTTWCVFRSVLWCCVKVRVVNGLPQNLSGGFILATNHNSHLDAHVLGSLIFRKIDWLSRVEFFCRPLSAFLLHAVSAIPIHRQGVPLRAIKKAISTLRSHGNIGICPEGEVRNGAESVVNGGRIKRGVGLLSYRTGAPVVPCVILGVEQLCQVEPWLPARRGEVWLNIGKPLYPRLDLPRKEAREMLCLELETQFCEMFAQIREKYAVPAKAIP